MDLSRSHWSSTCSPRGKRAFCSVQNLCGAWEWFRRKAGLAFRARIRGVCKEEGATATRSWLGEMSIAHVAFVLFTSQNFVSWAGYTLLLCGKRVKAKGHETRKRVQRKR
ncbi:hypothetical protein Naga_100182g15 [Nannochloropsis gaditana]|uniref:Uncharacterized protein n=1 Tax=Nannochloropsis gaditana TaxID=72520 RepID=W7U716_9STRA|nr:hypothetical protein Naga_100182g15 [Nannochloropsis gaditana]